MDEPRRLSGHQTGFSLLESLIVVSLLGIVLSIALPSYSRYASNQRARAAADTLASDLMVAQQEAITRRATVTVSFAAHDASCPGEGAASYRLGLPSTVIKRVCFPPDVVWGARPAGPLVFAPSGRTETATSLAVQSARTGTRFALSVAAETGVVTDATR